MNPFASRQVGLTGSCNVFQGHSGTGKTDEATECWIKAGMLFDGTCVALAPTRDVKANVRSFELGYVEKLNRARDDKRRESKSIERIIGQINFLRNDIYVYDNPAECFDKIRSLVDKNDVNDGTPQFSLLIDESAWARNDSTILQDVGPMLRNLCGIGFLTMHRGMAMPPQIRAVTRIRILWFSSDSTGDENLEKDIASIEGFKYSPVMSSTDKEEQFYRGIQYTANGPVQFEYNPHIERVPDAMLLPALPTAVRKRVLRGTAH